MAVLSKASRHTVSGGRAYSWAGSRRMVKAAGTYKIVQTKAVAMSILNAKAKIRRRRLLTVKPKPETIVSGTVNDVPAEFWAEIDTYLNSHK